MEQIKPILAFIAMICWIKYAIIPYVRMRKKEIAANKKRTKLS